MRVNCYAEELTDRIQIVQKEVNGQMFTGLRFYLELPATVAGKEYKGPFLHRGDDKDDDSSAVTFWSKRDLRELLSKAHQTLTKFYEEHQP